MEDWHKYWIRAGQGSVIRKDLDGSFEAQQAIMDGYEESAAYSSRASFFESYFHTRYITWDRFIRAHVEKSAKLFFVASGRGINEMRLKIDGYQVESSDLAVPDCHEANQRIFGAYAYRALDILREEPPQSDAIICLGLIYLFNASALDAFFRNVAAALVPGGRLILDAAGSEQSWLGSLYHRGFLKWEAWTHYLIRKVASRTPLSNFHYDIIILRHGYRWKTSEILEAAARHGLRLDAREDHDPLTDLSRSPLLSRVMARPDSFLARLLVWGIGNRLKHLRLFAFTKMPASGQSTPS